jgi:hypothetical protein
LNSSTKLSPGVIAAIVGSITAALFLHSYVFVRVNALKASHSKVWIFASIACGPVVWLLWSLHNRSNKVSPDDNTRVVMLKTESQVHLPVPSINASDF